LSRGLRHSVPGSLLAAVDAGAINVADVHRWNVLVVDSLDREANQLVVIGDPQHRWINASGRNQPVPVFPVLDLAEVFHADHCDDTGTGLRTTREPILGRKCRLLARHEMTAVQEHHQRPWSLLLRHSGHVADDSQDAEGPVVLRDRWSVGVRRELNDLIVGRAVRPPRQIADQLVRRALGDGCLEAQRRRVSAACEFDDLRPGGSIEQQRGHVVQRGGRERVQAGGQLAAGIEYDQRRCGASLDRPVDELSCLQQLGEDPEALCALSIGHQSTRLRVTRRRAAELEVVAGKLLDVRFIDPDRQHDDPTGHVGGGRPWIVEQQRRRRAVGTGIAGVGTETRDTNRLSINLQ